MPRSGVVQPQVRPSRGDRLVSDDAGLLWSATLVAAQGETRVMFACITDARRSGRTSYRAVGTGVRFAVLRDEARHDGLRHAPPVGRLH